MSESNTSLAEQAYNTILSRIIDITYPPGTILEEKGLVTELGISRTPIHSACIKLQQDGLITFLPKRGIRITTMDADFIRDIHDMREMIEPYCLEQFGRTVQKDHLFRYLEQFTAKDVPAKTLYDLDLDMHTEFVELANNKLLSNYYGTLKNHMARIAAMSSKYNSQRLEKSNKEHVNILIPLIEDDIPSAVNALKQHLVASRKAAYQVIVIREKMPVQNSMMPWTKGVLGRPLCPLKT